MLKNIQLKIILIFSILGIALISGFGAFLIINLQSIEPQVAVQTVQEIESYREVISMQIHNAKLVTIILIFSYGVISILIGIFVSKAILDPISRLIDSAPKIAAGENVEINNNLDGKDELTSAFNLMTNELRENLNEVNRQKRQIETILLHMTDGIIAFDMEGKIMHINPATTDLLKLTEKDNTFEKIFGKLNIDINLEKTIYLENWTSSEQRVQVEDKYLNIFFASFKDEKDRPSG